MQSSWDEDVRLCRLETSVCEIRAHSQRYMTNGSSTLRPFRQNLVHESTILLVSYKHNVRT